jgi:hypothetical protein
MFLVPPQGIHPFLAERVLRRTGSSIQSVSKPFFSLTALPTINTGFLHTVLGKFLLQRGLIGLIRIDCYHLCSQPKEDLRFEAILCTDIKDKIAATKSL